MRASIIASSLLVLLSACQAKPTPPKKTTKQDVEQTKEAEDEPAPAPPPEGVRAEIRPSRGPCARTLCIAGPGALTDAANLDLGDLCRRAPGVVRRCEGERCLSVWGLDEWRQGLDALIASLDRNADGKLGDGAEACSIRVAGWSQGAVIAATEVPAAVHAGVDNLVLVAPWAPDLERLEIPANVRKAWIYRHTKTPEDDCSRELDGGPRLSPAPVCAATTSCWDYDFSLAPELAFLSRRGARAGSEIGHCNIAAVVSTVGLDNLAHGIEAPAEHVPRYANGEAGGRKREPGPPN